MVRQSVSHKAVFSHLNKKADSHASVATLARNDMMEGFLYLCGMAARRASTCAGVVAQLVQKRTALMPLPMLCQ